MVAGVLDFPTVPKDDPNSVYLFRDGPTEVVRLDDERRARDEARRPRSSVRPKRGPALDVQTTDELRDSGIAAEVLDGAALRALAIQLVDEICARAPGDVAPILGRLVLHYETAESRILERFPGPLWIDARRLTDGHVHARAISALSACLVAVPDLAVRTTLTLLHSPRSEQRNVAAFLARDIARGELLPRLFELALHDDPSARLASITVLPDVAHVDGFDAHLARLREFAIQTEARIARRAIQALEELRDAASVPILVDTLRVGDPEVADAARSALRIITGREQGRFRWMLWLRSNQSTPRFQWLVEALGQQDEELRRVASSELGRLTGTEPIRPPSLRPTHRPPPPEVPMPTNDPRGRR